MRLLRSFVTPLGFIVAISFCANWFARADTSPEHNAGGSVGAVAPIFRQLVYFRVPVSFVSVFEETHGDRYIHEWVLSGESVSNWTQMITLTGAQNVSQRHPEATPKAFAGAIASRFQRTCPTSFSAKGIYEGQLNAQDTFILVVGCGNAPTSAGHSETAVIAVVKGENDFYTLQWAQRADATPTPKDIDVNLWAGRIKSLMPLKLCPIVAGERPPYPSCVGS
ncbi:MAG: hypothetical protein EPN70_21790 [Paraburkholderia sp.]|uniref:hypothetical protein n=1 Tax=Paraburkholderia sp. TaxID=1926495 RepID=UPI001201FA8C|nr:hypothetical protein [Paraburkholderia sp.]TAM00609.1 MAG: hypothetical protein EPN70_21790 [Paraburkholderia sp.]TAM31447.1 MAG: hypothetical protein EPN59_04680 [Paraburkholderia sp.]